ncbi:MAG: ABC transporter ATP-binding protein [Desulfomicrobiaceae bacterium]|nr:ABC transporter ATP-binding protein [Desulfomicrobiaceae bacterium]
MSVQPLLQLRDVSKSFRGLMAVSQVSLEVGDGEVVGLIGPNGAGKTTVFNLISGFLCPDEGEILFRGHSLVGHKPHQVCRLGLARTFQIVKPFGNLNVLENVAVGAFNRFPSIAEAEAKAWETLQLIGLEHKAFQPANSLTTPDRKRLELARALATGPKLLLLDEVMAGLNPSEKFRMTDLVRKIRSRGVAVLIIEHAMRVIMELSDRIYVLNYGRCICAGPPHTVCNNAQVIEAYIGKGYAEGRGP